MMFGGVLTSGGTLRTGMDACGTLLFLEAACPNSSRVQPALVPRRTCTTFSLLMLRTNHPDWWYACTDTGHCCSPNWL